MFRYFLFLILCASCQKTDSFLKPQTVRLNLTSDPKTLDPRKARDLNEMNLMRMFFEGLTRISKTGQIELALAQDVEVSSDQTRYLFHLRKSFWSNGEQVTSFDFAESWKAILDPQFPTDIAYHLYVIKNARKAKLGEMGLERVGIQTPDPYTLIVELEYPVPYFLQLLSMSPFFPISHKRANTFPDWAVTCERYLCNGPFKPEQWLHSDKIQIVKNPHYWQAKDVRLQEIDLYMTSADTELRMYEEKKLDWAGSPLSSISTDAIRSLKESNQLCVQPFLATYFYRINTSDLFRAKKNPLSNSYVRRALAYAIDRQSITEHILQGGHSVAKALVPPALGLSDRGYFLDHNAQLAQTYLMDGLLELDLTLATLDPIVISYRGGDDRGHLIAQAVQRQLESILHISVVLEAVEPKVYFQRIAQKDYQLAAGSWVADFADPINFLEIFKFKDIGTNGTQWESSKYIDLLNRSQLCSDIEERKHLLREAEQILMEQMPLIPIFHYVLNYLQTPNLTDVVLSPLGQLDFRWAQVQGRR